MSDGFDSPQALGDLHRAIRGPRPVLIDFGAAWCPPCRRLSATLQRVAPEYDIQILAVDIERAPDIASHYRVRSVPTLLGFRDGAVVVTESGFGGESRLRKLLAQLSS